MEVLVRSSAPPSLHVRFFAHRVITRKWRRLTPVRCESLSLGESCLHDSRSLATWPLHGERTQRSVGCFTVYLINLFLFFLPSHPELYVCMIRGRLHGPYTMNAHNCLSDVCLTHFVCESECVCACACVYVCCHIIPPARVCVHTHRGLAREQRRLPGAA